MKKQLILVDIMILICLLFSGCEDKDMNRIKFIIVNNCSHEIYGINYKYYIGNELVYSGGVKNFNHKDIQVGDDAKIDIIKEEIPKDKNLSNLSIQYSVVLYDKTEQCCKNIIKLKAKYGEVYYLSLTGNAYDGFNIKVK